jgi:hypothetical protein
MPTESRLGFRQFASRAVLAVAIVAIVALGLGSGTADAAKKRTQKSDATTDAVYRCRNAAGHPFFGQSIPPECMDMDVEVLDSNGRVVRVIPGRKSLESVTRAQQDADAVAAAVQRDRTLLATYLTVADIERLRDQRIELLEQQDVVTRQYISSLRERQARLMTSAQRFRPYSSKPNAPALPDQVAAEIVNTVNGLQVYEQEMTKNTAERAELTAKFASDIARFKELKGVQ